MNHYKVLVSINLEFNILANSEEDAEELIMQTDQPELLESALHSSVEVDSCDQLSGDEAIFANADWGPL